MESNEITPTENLSVLKQTKTLGSLRLLDEEKRIILVPTPSQLPGDPLNWYVAQHLDTPKLMKLYRSKAHKYYIVFLVCFTIFIGAFVVAAPVVQIIALAMEFGDHNPAHVTFWISKVSYFFSAAALLQGMGNFVWIPFTNKYGRRPVYIVSQVILLASILWAVLSHSYASELAARLFMGFSAGASECLGPLSIAEIFFLHQRGGAIA